MGKRESIDRNIEVVALSRGISDGENISPAPVRNVL